MAGVCADFFIAGAPRCGTTSLASYLRGHPEICFSSPKETHYFLSGALQPELLLDPQRHYIDRFFPHYDAAHHRCIGEGSVSYLYFPDVLDRILKLNPDARFIVMLRNPMQMVPSFHARMVYLLEEDTHDFAEAWQLQDRRARGERIPPRCLLPSLLQYSEIGKLGKYLGGLFARVPRSQCLPILYEDLASQTSAVYESVLEFLGVEHDGQTRFDVRLPGSGYRHRWLQQLLYKPPSAVLSFVGNNDILASRAFLRVKRLRKKLLAYNTIPGPATAPPSAEMRAILRDTFKGDSEQLAELLGRDLRHWYDETAEEVERRAPSERVLVG